MRGVNPGEKVQFQPGGTLADFLTGKQPAPEPTQAPQTPWNKPSMPGDQNQTEAGVIQSPTEQGQNPELPHDPVDQAVAAAAAMAILGTSPPQGPAHEQCLYGAHGEQGSAGARRLM